MKELHEYVKLFPRMPEKDFEELVEDIRTNGLHDPITIHEGKVVDGRHRLEACEKAGVEPRFETWDGKGDLLAFIASKNLLRRHLEKSARQIIAGEISKLRRGRPSEKTNASIEAITTQPDEISQDEAARMMNVSRSSVQRARRVIEAAPELAEQVKEGKMSLNAAVERLPKKKPKKRHNFAPAQFHCATGNLIAAIRICKKAKWEGLSKEDAIREYRSVEKTFNEKEN